MNYQEKLVILNDIRNYINDKILDVKYGNETLEDFFYSVGNYLQRQGYDLEHNQENKSTWVDELTQDEKDTLFNFMGGVEE